MRPCSICLYERQICPLDTSMLSQMPRFLPFLEINNIPLCGHVWAFFCFLFFAVLRLELRAYTLSHSTVPCLCVRYFWDIVSQTICQSWLWSTILLISASWVARITGVSHSTWLFLYSFVSRHILILHLYYLTNNASVNKRAKLAF
jgi:hypothetical protein